MTISLTIFCCLIIFVLGEAFLIHAEDGKIGNMVLLLITFAVISGCLCVMTYSPESNEKLIQQLESEVKQLERKVNER